ncbi:hypothetical protein RLEG12_15365 [Rhizobium leguminosarum bv. trifolii CB782]|uniref:Uncharacterized protein n=1 Tax=Rhizobium hidalgonense TaxID=1538159 RepID=A0A2A6K607_9HYPH|nr:hypothetical protein [Rhizobium hidalgonense]AHG44516.1 hypothetical protein RLEG12_15365 [Rhizobium leguminosarum bv. trifolii CB782]MDR9776831.1 hypothetical protein [Rhizobium hidalgonense]MDR9807843.1 hypothetical protein [Rhizobium hidalgonense]MDR9813248.1 hypothetical protein [Rhizobium hidalgonense]MDR9821311.1 hypothetical protein [Rhizobium hidalgonense]
MIGKILIVAAGVTFAVMFWLMLQLIAGRPDLLKMTPAEHGWYAKRILPLMLLSAAFTTAGALAKRWGWP